MAADPRRLTAVRQIAADISWARTPNRSERTEAGYRASPMSIDYWIADVRSKGVREEDVEAAARSAHRAWQRQNSLKAAAARAKSAEQRRQPNPLRRSA
jgi:hypothetical protein